MLGTLTKATSVLMLFSDKPDWGVSEVSRELGLPKSSTHSLLASLAQTGLLERTHDSRYRLGWRLLTLSRNFLEGSSVRAHAYPTVVALRSRLDATINVATLNNGLITYIDKVDGRRVPAMARWAVGSRAPAHSTALGKALLAYSSAIAVDEAADASHLQRYTKTTICRISELHAELDEVRRVGYACDREETLPGLYCFAAPLLDTDGRAIAAISISLPRTIGVPNHEYLGRMILSASTQIVRSMRNVARSSIPGALPEPTAAKSN